MAERYIHWLLQQRWVVLALLVVITIVAGASGARIRFDSSIESWFIESDPSLATYDRFTQLFNADQIVVVGIFADDVFAPPVVAAVSEISSRTAELEFVDRVQSVTNAARLGQSRDFRQHVLGSPLLKETLISADLDGTAIVIYYSRAGNTYRQKRAFVRAVRRIVDEATADLQLDTAISGAPVIGEAAQLRNASDMSGLVPLMIVVIVVTSLIVFRRLSLTLMPLGVVGIAVIWAFGLKSFLGWHMSMISAILVPLILAVGVANSIHIVAAYQGLVEQGQQAAVRSTVARLIKPCFFASATTAAGLLSLLVSDLAPVREFAVIAAAGVLAAFVLSISLLPVMLSLIARSDAMSEPRLSRYLPPVLESLFAFARTRTRGIIAAALLATVFSVWAATRVDAGLDPLMWIPTGESIRADAERIDEQFGGGLSLEFLVSAQEGRLDEPAALRRLEAFQAWLVDNTPVVGATSVADLVKEAARIARDEGESGYALPRLAFLTESLLERLEKQDQLAPWLTTDRKTGRIGARIPLTSAQDIVDHIPVIQQRIHDEFQGSGLQVQMTGHAVLVGLMQTRMIESQLYSFSVALAVVSLIMVLLLRSLRLGLIALVPNLLPIAIGLATMAVFDISFNPATVMVAAVALGIVVDDTVHMMTAFERGVRAGNGVTAAIRSTVLEVGRPVVVTSLLLAAGFALLLFGSFLPSRQIGALIATIAIAALLTDLVLLPALLMQTSGTSRRNGSTASA